MKNANCFGTILGIVVFSSSSPLPCAACSLNVPDTSVSTYSIAGAASIATTFYER